MKVSSKGPSNKSPQGDSPRPTFEHRVVRAVWDRTTREPGFETFSMDALGTPINRFDYGKKSEYGWEIDFIVPPEQGGSVDLTNLQALHWKNKLARQSPHPPKNNS